MNFKFGGYKVQTGGTISAFTKPIGPAPQMMHQGRHMLWLFSSHLTSFRGENSAVQYRLLR